MGNSSGFVAGNLTREPELKYVGQGDGQALLKFSVASEKSWKNKDGDWDSEVSYFDVIAWRKLAENNAELLEKGMPVVVLGDWAQQRWENDEGENRSRVVFEAVRISYDGMGIASIERKQRGEGGKGKPKAVKNEAPDPYDRDEEPF